MIDLIGKAILLDSIKEVISKILNKVNENYFNTVENNTRLSEALTSINQAILETSKFIKNEGFVVNTDLSKLWHDALDKSVAANLNDGLPDYLYHKADFWGDPTKWIDKQDLLEIVPQLDYLKNKCDEIMLKLKK